MVEEVVMDDYQRIFDRFFIVSLPWPQTCSSSTKPELRFSFPLQAPTDAVSQAVPLFCFPEDSSTLLRKPKAGRETFSFVLTTTSSAKEHAYCRRSFRETSVDCLCIMSEQPSFNLFSQILDLVEERWHDESSMHVLVPLLSAIQQQPFPAPGHRIELQLYTTVEGEEASESTGEVEQMCLYRPSGNDYILDYISFSLLFSRVKVEVILQLFDCLVGERRIILVADDLSTLSGCATAACAMLNPFCWQHVFIPVLPSSLLDYCCAPMPFFTGVTSSCMEQVKMLPMEEVYMLNLSTGEWELFPNLPQVLPPGLAASLGRSLAEIAHYSTDDTLSRKKFDVSVARRFKYFIYSLLGSYAEFTTGEDFRRPEFLAHFADPIHRAFAASFTQTQMFEQFIDERVQMRRNGNLNSCTLLKVARQSRASMRIDPTELSFCGKCSKPLEANFETVHGKPLCQRCAERKKRLTWKGFITDNSSKWGAGWLFKKAEAEDAASSPAMGSFGSLTNNEQPQQPSAAQMYHQQQIELRQNRPERGPERGLVEPLQPMPEAEEIVVQSAVVSDNTAMRICHAQPARMVQIKRAMPAGRTPLQTSKLSPAPMPNRTQVVMQKRPRGATTHTATSMSSTQQRQRGISHAEGLHDFPAGSGPVQKNAGLLAMEAVTARRPTLQKATTAAAELHPTPLQGVAVVQKARTLPQLGGPPIPPFRKPLETEADEKQEGANEKATTLRVEKLGPVKLERVNAVKVATVERVERVAKVQLEQALPKRMEQAEKPKADASEDVRPPSITEAAPVRQMQLPPRQGATPTSPSGRGRRRGPPREGRGGAAVGAARGAPRGARGGERGRGVPHNRGIRRGIAAPGWAVRGRGSRGGRGGARGAASALAAEAVNRPPLASGRGGVKRPPIVLSRSMPGSPKRMLSQEPPMSASAPSTVVGDKAPTGGEPPSEAAMVAPLKRPVVRDASAAAAAAAQPAPHLRSGSPMKQWPEVKASRQMKFE